MAHSMVRIALALTAPLLLFGCLLSPGKFESTLSINADRTFRFAYKGEVIAVDPSDQLGSSMTDSSGETSEDAEATDDGEASSDTRAQADTAAEAAQKKAELERKRRQIADALSKEQGYRSVQYMGDGKYLIDYAISGKLDHNFVYPYNIDGEVLFPFIAIELRNNNSVRVKAPAFGREVDKASGLGGNEAADLVDGTFTLDTDAEIISQNNEDGAETVGNRKVIRWQASALKKPAPTAVLRMRQ